MKRLIKILFKRKFKKLKKLNKHRVIGEIGMLNSPEKVQTALDSRGQREPSITLPAEGLRIWESGGGDSC